MDAATLLAREGVRETMARYNLAGDVLRVDDYVAVFAEDAVLETGTARHEGREAIRAWFAGWRDAPAAGAVRRSREAPRFVRHHLATSQVTVVDADTAEARTYWTVFTQIGADHGGTYLDRFRRERDRWLIVHRIARTGWYAPGSLLAGGDK